QISKEATELLKKTQWTNEVKANKTQNSFHIYHEFKNNLRKTPTPPSPPSPPTPPKFYQNLPNLDIVIPSTLEDQNGILTSSSPACVFPESPLSIDSQSSWEHESSEEPSPILGALEPNCPPVDYSFRFEEPDSSVDDSGRVQPDFLGYTDDFCNETMITNTVFPCQY